MKPYFVYEYLMRYSDANHVVSASEIVGYLQECGISAEEAEAILQNEKDKP